jgi:two-component system nitrogen regulation sensor histidine kinase NtrY
MICLLDGAVAEIVQIRAGTDLRTLAVKIVNDQSGHVLTFDDITQQLSDQRRAAWSDVARRIAHEIKNPLTPIQLAAERLQRRYAEQISNDRPTFTRLTETIVRQVGDLRRIVDEFSSFARMPKPVFRNEVMADIARHALFLHEVAHPEVRFVFSMEKDDLNIVCDRQTDRAGAHQRSKKCCRSSRGAHCCGGGAQWVCQIMRMTRTGRER